ncbi:MAG: hypothetical protein EA364_02945 [Balneolaceae bacterium]|nr:MAG: hypothetical protein EA364_02945 [Balneolaceae bacterium]
MLSVPLLLSYEFGYGQTGLERVRSIEVAGAGQPIFLDYFVIESGLRVYLADSLISPQHWTYNQAEGTWVLNRPAWPEGEPRVLAFRYRVIPVSLQPVYRARELVPAVTDTADAPTDGTVLVSRPVTRSDLFGDSRLTRSGSLTRGISFGTNRDFSLESGLRFELSGFITEDVEVLATLTDQTTPIQPDGSTQNLREFDKVYIRLNSPYGQVQLGDIDVSLQNSQFARVQRRLQGADVFTSSPATGSLNAAGAVVRGEFRTQSTNGSDGVQGPYRLSGSQGEQFIIVLAGTERVYLDGVRVNRGEENDYVIDYGLGEITFTPARIITNASRIVVEFQYITQEYTRTLVATEAEADNLLDGRLMVGASFIRESDDKNLLSEFGLSDEERRILEMAGNNLEQAIISGADSVGFRRDADFILYARRDTVFQGQPFTIFRHQPGDSAGVFRVRFSRVDDGAGSYRRARSTSNGIVYEWVGPGLGSYEPFRRIPAPENRIMATIRSRYRITPGISMYGELAGSSFDRNRFSDLGNTNNNDSGYYTGISMAETETVAGLISFDFSHRFTGRNFSYFDRVRDVEFDRTWNITDTEVTGERISEAFMAWQPASATRFEYTFGMLGRDNIGAYRHRAGFVSREEGLPFVEYDISYADSREDLFGVKGEWLRQTGTAGYDLAAGANTVTPTIRVEHENREQVRIDPDSLTNQSLMFVDLMPGLAYRTSEGRFRASVSYALRDDNRADRGLMRDESRSFTRRFSVEYRPGAVLQTTNTLAFRKREYSDYFRETLQFQDNRSVVLQSNTLFRPMNRFIDMLLFYEINTESRALLQETFIEVGPELGQYIWVDLNNDGVQQVDEFFPAPTPGEGIYVKQFIPSDELFPVISLNTRLRARISPERIIRADASNSTLLNILRNIELNSILDIRERNTTSRLEDIYLLRLNTFRDDSLTIDGRLYWQQEIDLFKQNRLFDLRFSVDQNLGLSRRATGLDEQESVSFRFYSTLRTLRGWQFTVAGRSASSLNTSENLPGRNYDIRDLGIEPEVRYEISRALQVGLGSSVIRKTDRFSPDNATLNTFRLRADTRIFAGMGMQGQGRIEYRSNRLTGTTSSLGEFEMTEGAGLGSTFLWSAGFSWRVSEFIRATVNYDGRTITDRPTVQTLRVVFTAVF